MQYFYLNMPGGILPSHKNKKHPPNNPAKNRAYKWKN